MKAVNLLPRDTKHTGANVSQHLPVLVGVTVACAVVAVLAGGYVLEHGKVQSAQRALDAAKTQLAGTPLPPRTSSLHSLPTPAVVTSTQQPLLTAVSSALSQRIAWDRILSEFSRVVPSDVWLSSLQLTTPAPATPGTAPTSGLALEGTTYSYDSVARLLSRLSLIPDLADVTLASTSRSGQLVQFSVSAGVKGAVAPPASTATDTTSTTTTTTTTP